MFNNIINGVVNLPWWGYVVYTLIVTHITIVAVTVFLHRCQAHRALTLHPIVSHFFRLWLWLTTGMDTRAWTAIHRKHHAKCETPDDPHSPQVLGIKQVLYEGAELYRLEAKNQETIERFGQGTPDDWLEKHLYRKYSAKGFLITLAVNFYLFGLVGIIIWAIQMAWIPFFAAGVINGLGHFIGYRNFDCKDASKNLLPFGLLIGGEELHNNHHSFPASAKLSVKWWEFDLGWFYIKLFACLGLAKIKRLPPKMQIHPNKSIIDVDTIKALIAGRLQIMTQYCNQVLIPILKQERNFLAGGLTPKFKRLLIKEVSSLDSSKVNLLEDFLSKTHKLQIAYDLRIKLVAIWDQKTATTKELIDAVQEWCRQAESTGIECIQEFVRNLPGYYIAPAN